MSGDESQRSGNGAGWAQEGVKERLPACWGVRGLRIRAAEGQRGGIGGPAPSGRRQRTAFSSTLFIGGVALPAAPIFCGNNAPLPRPPITTRHKPIAI